MGYSDAELVNMGGYDLVHYDDLAYVASAHQERKYFKVEKNNFLKKKCQPYIIMPLLDCWFVSKLNKLFSLFI